MAKYEKAKELYETWHDFDNESILEIDIPEPEFPLEVKGPYARIDYSSPKWHGDPVYYYHIIKRNPPMYAEDRKGNEFILGYIDVAGNYRVENGNKISNGIDDWPRSQPKHFVWPRPSTRQGVTKLGVLGLIQYFNENGRLITKNYSDRFLVAHPNGKVCYISSPHPDAVRQGTGRANPLISGKHLAYSIVSGGAGGAAGFFGSRSRRQLERLHQDMVAEAEENPGEIIIPLLISGMVAGTTGTVVNYALEKYDEVHAKKKKNPEMPWGDDP